MSESEERCSREDPARVLGRVFEEVWNQGLVSVLDEVLDDEFVGHGAGGDSFTRRQLAERVCERRRALPDLRYEVLQYVVDRPWVATMWTGRGTPVASVDGDAAESTCLSGLTLWRLHRGRVAEAWVLGFEGPHGWTPPDGQLPIG